MAYGFRIFTGDGGVSEISDSDRPVWFFMGVFQHPYNTSTPTDYMFANPNGYTKFSLTQDANGDGWVWGTVSRSGSSPPPPIETLWSAIALPTFTISGGNVIVSMSTNPVVGFPPTTGGNGAIWTCRLYGQR